MEPASIAIVIGIVVVILIAIVLVSRRSNASNVSEAAPGWSAPAPARPSNIPVTVKRKGHDFTTYYNAKHGSWGFFLGDDWIIYDMLMDGAYLGLFDAAYPDEPFLPEGDFMEPPGAYATEPESAIEATPEPVAPIETEPTPEPVSESTAPARELAPEPIAPAPEPAPSPDPPPSFGGSDFGSSDFGGGDFGGGDD